MPCMRQVIRRLLFPILIVGIAAFLTIKGSIDRDREREAVRAFATAAVLGGHLGATEPFIADALRASLPPNRVYSVEVRDGDGGPAPDGSASHVVMVRRDGLAYIGLRCRYDPDPGKIAVVGVFEPGLLPATPQPNG